MIIIKNFLKIRRMLSLSQKKQLNIFIILFLFAVLLEMLGIGMVIPIINLLSQGDSLLQNNQFISQFNLFEFSLKQGSK